MYTYTNKETHMDMQIHIHVQIYTSHTQEEITTDVVGYQFNFKHSTRDNLKIFICSAAFQDPVSIDEA